MKLQDCSLVVSPLIVSGTMPLPSWKLPIVCSFFFYSTSIVTAYYAKFREMFNALFQTVNLIFSAHKRCNLQNYCENILKNRGSGDYLKPHRIHR